VGGTEEFPEGSDRVVNVGGRKIGVFNIPGQFYGLPNVCPHQTGPLCEGQRLLGTTTARAETGWRTEWGFLGMGSNTTSPQDDASPFPRSSCGRTASRRGATRW
jgi:phenylpropionate dioxygenase-like ring-hydroxylating dioxygenase large terminal subunit